MGTRRMNRHVVLSSLLLLIALPFLFVDHLLRRMSLPGHLSPFLRPNTNILPGPVFGEQVTGAAGVVLVPESDPVSVVSLEHSARAVDEVVVSFADGCIQHVDDLGCHVQYFGSPVSSETGDGASFVV